MEKIRITYRPNHYLTGNRSTAIDVEGESFEWDARESTVTVFDSNRVPVFAAATEEVRSVEKVADANDPAIVKLDGREVARSVRDQAQASAVSE